MATYSFPLHISPSSLSPVSNQTYQNVTTSPLSNILPEFFLPAHRFTHTLSFPLDVSKSVFRVGYMEGPVTVMIWKTWLWRKRRAGRQKARVVRCFRALRRLVGEEGSEGVVVVVVVVRRRGCVWGRR